MKRNLLIILLVASITFNLAFIGTFLFLKFRPSRSIERFDVQSKDRNKIWFSYLHETRQQHHDLAEDMKKLKQEFFYELMKENYNVKKLKEITKDIIEKQSEMEKFLAERLVKARSKMDTQTAARFFRNVGRRHFEEHPMSPHNNPNSDRMFRNKRDNRMRNTPPQDE